MKYDVIVIGAGPAGSTAAKYLAENGINTLLLDKDAFPRDKPCAGGLCHHIDQFTYLSDYLHSSNEMLKSTCRGSIIYVPHHKHMYSYHANKDLFYNVFRTDFDALLIDFAKKAGAIFQSNSLVVDLNHTPKKVEVTLTNGKKHAASFCIIADGTNSKAGGYVRNLLGYEKKWKKHLNLSIVEEIPVPTGFIDQQYGKDRMAMVYFKYDNLKGYAWIFPKKESINIGFVGLYHEMKTYDLKKGFQKYIDFLKNHHFLPDNCESTHMKGDFIPFNGPLKKTWYQNMVLIGDAAGYVSPMSGEGIYYAMDSGRIAAETIIKHHHKIKNINKFFRSYHQECMNAWGKQLKLYNLFSRILLSYPDLLLYPAQMNRPLQKIYGDVFNGDSDPIKDTIWVPLMIYKGFITNMVHRNFPNSK